MFFLESGKRCFAELDITVFYTLFSAFLLYVHTYLLMSSLRAIYCRGRGSLLSVEFVFIYSDVDHNNRIQMRKTLHIAGKGRNGQKHVFCCCFHVLPSKTIGK